MALTIKQLLNYSWMSQASYLDFSGLAIGDRDALTGKLTNNTINEAKEFSTGQAATFTGSATPSDSSDGYSFINTHPNDSTARVGRTRLRYAA
ncbi:MAG: hypothetical protein ACXWT5_13410 [Methylophilus sp.]